MSGTFQAGDIVAIEYRMCGNGPWNYLFERPPNGVTHVRAIGVYVGETERHIMTAHDFSKFEDGRVEPVRCQHWGKDGYCVFTVLAKSPSPPRDGEAA